MTCLDSGQIRTHKLCQHLFQGPSPSPHARNTFCASDKCNPSLQVQVPRRMEMAVDILYECRPCPRTTPPLSWLCASHPISAARLCVAQRMLLDFVSIGLPCRHHVSSNIGVEVPLKRFPSLFSLIAHAQGPPVLCWDSLASVFVSSPSSTVSDVSKSWPQLCPGMPLKHALIMVSLI